MKHTCWNYCNVNAFTIYVLGPSFIAHEQSVRSLHIEKEKKTGSVTSGNRPVAWLEWR